MASLWRGRVRRLAPVAAPERPSATRPQDAILPHKRASALAYKYAQMPAVLRLNRAGLHFHVAHPAPTPQLLPMLRLRYSESSISL